MVQKTKPSQFLCISIALSVFLFACQGAEKRIKSLTIADFPSDPPKTESEIRALLPSVKTGYVLYDPGQEKILEADQENQSLIPGSTAKLFSTTAALKILGRNYQFKTKLNYSGKIEKGILKGNLYLVGGGDPSLKVENLMDLSRSLKKFGIKQIEGSFYYDESYLIPSRQIDETREPWASYNTGLSALSIDFNQSKVYWYPIQDRSSYAVVPIPQIPNQRFDLGDEFSPSDTSFNYYQSKEEDVWILSSSLVQGGKARLPVKSPAQFVAHLFVKFSNLNGIELPPPQPGFSPKTAKTLRSHLSRPLQEIVASILEYSNNTMAELVMMTTARELAKRSVSLTDAAAVLQSWFKKQIPNLTEENFHFENGSGLSSRFRCTPFQEAKILEFVDSFLVEAPSYQSFMPISGWKGTLADRFSEPGMDFRVWAKTGSLSYVASLAGYVQTQSGKRLLFSIISNEMTERARIEEIAQPLNQRELQKISAWRQRALRFQSELLLNWVKKY